MNKTFCDFCACLIRSDLDKRSMCVQDYPDKKSKLTFDLCPECAKDQKIKWVNQKKHALELFNEKY